MVVAILNQLVNSHYPANIKYSDLVYNKKVIYLFCQNKLNKE